MPGAWQPAPLAASGPTPVSPHFAARHWYRLSAVSIALWPLSLAFGAAVLSRRWLYRAGILRSVRLGVPVIVLGNVTVGGTGKTPLVLRLAEILREQGRKPGIVCRGYGGTGKAPRAVAAGDDPALVGDEPVLLAGRCACPVWVGIDRAAAAQALLAAHPECNVLLCDDGLQHYRLARDLEIVVSDERGHGNGFLLPAGPLREPADRPCDALVVNRGPAAAAQAPNGGGLQSRARAAARVFAMRLQPAGFHWVHDPGSAVPISGLAGRRLHAVAGIGNPQRFFDTLGEMGLAAVTHAFPDHHAYSRGDLEFADCDTVLMTEKDAVKCRSFGRTDLVALRVEARLGPAFTDFIRARLPNARA